MKLPARTLDTMSDAIAMSSPSGRTSKRAKAAAIDRLGTALFGDPALRSGTGLPPQPSKIERLRATAARLRDLAARGLSPRKFEREAMKIDAQIAQLEDL